MKTSKFPQQQLLPYDGECIYYGKLFSEDRAQEIYQTLQRETVWRQDQVMMFGKPVTTKRKVAFYAIESRSYQYSGVQKQSMVYTDLLTKLQQAVQAITSADYNACLLNYYANGEEGMGYHRDNEPEMEQGGSIAALSFGAERKFVLKHDTNKEKVEFYLPSGSLMEMKGATQAHWKHQLPKSKKVANPRISLTFRKFIH